MNDIPVKGSPSQLESIDRFWWCYNDDNRELNDNDKFTINIVIIIIGFYRPLFFPFRVISLTVLDIQYFDIVGVDSILLRDWCDTMS